jgi:hypothetical protein
VERNIPIQCLAEKAIRERRVQTLIVMQKAGCSFSNGKASNKVVLGEVLKRELGVAANCFCEGGELEEPTYFSVGGDVAKEAPHYTGKQDRTPSFYLVRGHRWRDKDRSVDSRRVTAFPVDLRVAVPSHTYGRPLSFVLVFARRRAICHRNAY